MPTLTSTQLEALALRDHEAKLAVEIDTASPLRYCTGINPVQVGSDWYTPRAIWYDLFKIAAPGDTVTSLTFDDLDNELRVAWYSERFSAADVTVYLLIRNIGEVTWTTTLSVVWKCRACRYTRDGKFIVDLYGAAGMRPRAGLRVGTRSEFEYAPEPGEAVRFRQVGITFHGGSTNPPPTGGGYNPPLPQTQPIMPLQGD